MSITSDNGTNFTSGNKELKTSIREWNKSATESWLKQRGIVRNFNSPSGSHFGGYYELEIRTIRKVLSSLFTEQNLKMRRNSVYSTL